MRRARLHIGTHRTGTTSLQRLLADHRAELRRAGYNFPEGMAWPDNHVELWFAAMRPERLQDLARFLDWALGRLGDSLTSCQDPRWFAKTRENILQTPGDDLVYSCEGLCLLRYPDEVERLRLLFEGADLSVVLVHREPNAFLASYEWAMQITGSTLSEDPDSIMYTRPDSWLVDYEARIVLWEGVLGRRNVHVLDYDTCVAESGSALPAVLDALGLGVLVGRSETYRLNARF